MSWKELLQPAIDLALKGFNVTVPLGLHQTFITLLISSRYFDKIKFLFLLNSMARFK